MNKYELLETIGEGAYGIVIKAKCKETGRLVAIKRFKESDEDELVRKTTLREVKILRSLKDEQYIVKLLEAFRRKGRLYLVFEYVGKNLLEFLEEHPKGIPEPQLKRMVFSMLLSLYACHSNGVIHRDIKPENLLLSKDNTLRLCDFGFARQYTGGAKDLTDYVATRWYRSPELLLGTTDYSLPTDLFAAGCIMAELIDGQPLFPGESEIDQMHLIQRMLGRFTPHQQETFARNPRFGNHTLSEGGPEGHSLALERKYGQRIHPQGIQLLKKLLAVDPASRPTAVQALQDPYLEGLAAELSPSLVSVLAVSVPTAGSPAPDASPNQTQLRPDTRGGIDTASAGARRRSATRPLLPATVGTGYDDGSSMPSIGSRPASRGQIDLPSQPSDRQQRSGVSSSGNTSTLRNIGAPKPLQPQSSQQQSNSNPPGGYGTPVPYSSGALPMHRTGSGQGRRGPQPAQVAPLPKPLRGPTDVLDSPDMMASPATYGQGFSSAPSAPMYNGNNAPQTQYPSYNNNAYGTSSSHPYKPPTSVHSSGNLPRLGGGAALTGLPPSGNGPAPTPQNGAQPYGNPGHGYNPFLAGGRGGAGARQPGAGRFGAM